MARQPQRRSAPTRAQLIHLLIEERAKVVAMGNTFAEDDPHVPVDDHHRAQARREIEREVLCPQR